MNVCLVANARHSGARALWKSQTFFFFKLEMCNVGTCRKVLLVKIFFLLLICACTSDILIYIYHFVVISVAAHTIDRQTFHTGASGDHSSVLSEITLAEQASAVGQMLHWTRLV